jgi:two-component system, chemotaxis family, sensor kinase Cph1
VAMPQYVERYLAPARVLCETAAMAIHAARLFQREKNLAAALQDKVEELDAFAYIVSHDLKAPVSAMRTRLGYIQEDAGDQLPAEAAEHLTAVVASAGRMQRLIGDLLKLTRVGRQQVTPEKVDLDALVADVAGDLAIALQERSCELTVAPLPPVMASPEWVREVFHNLLTNAIKYNDKEPPHIAIAARAPRPDDPGGADPSLVVLYVRDDGVGIPPDLHDRAFELFHRVEGSEGTEGSGAGLAIVRKIVEREGGRIWLQSEPGEGSTFFFTLPRA